MIDGWVLAIVLLFVILIAGLYVIGVRIMTQNEIIVKAIPFGAPKIMERRSPAQPEDHRTRPVGATRAEPSGRHG